MHLNADFTQRVVVRPQDYEWVDSPMPGVQRMMLDRIGGEVARATSLVRYAPNSAFSRHVHGGGEEFLVLEGEFGDEHGTYPVGSYVRNPVGTAHTPTIAGKGCTIFVKLHQFSKRDLTRVVIDTRNAQWSAGDEPGSEVLHLHGFGGERVALLRWAPNTGFSRHRHEGGEELFVIDGAISDEQGEYPAGSWIRSPDRSSHAPTAGPHGALLYVKVGHLEPGD